MNPQQNPYDFILNSGNQPKSSLPLPLPTPDTSTKKGRIILVSVVGMIGLIIAIVGYSIISGAGKTDINALVSIAAKQTELMRVAGLSKDKAQSLSTSSLAATVSTTLLSDQQAIIDVLKNNGKKISAKELSSAKSSKTDTALDTASKNNRFDEEFIATLQTQLTSYQQALKNRYNSSSSSSEKKALNNAYTHISTILTVPTPTPKP